MPHRWSRPLARRTVVAGLACVAALTAVPTGPAVAHPTHSASHAPAAKSAGTSAGTSAAKSPERPSVTFGIGAANAKGVDGRPYLNYDVSPGAQLTDHVVLVNLARRPVTLTLYTADGTNATNGALGYSPRAHPGTDARTWIGLGFRTRDPKITVAARGTRVLPIAVHVPSAASPGDHVAGVVAAVQSRVLGRSGQRITFEQRVVLRAFFRVSGDVRAALAVTAVHADWSGSLVPAGSGTATISYTVRNAGNVNLAGTQRLVLTGPFGATGTVPALARVPLLLPGSSVTERVAVAGVRPEVLLHARVTVTPLGVSGSADPALQPSSAQTSFAAVPWTLFGLIAAFLALVAALFVYRRKHPRAAGRHGAARSKAGASTRSGRRTAPAAAS